MFGGTGMVIDCTLYGTCSNSAKFVYMLYTPVNLCQTIALIPTMTYYLTFDVYVFPIVNTSTTYVYLNNNLILSVNQTYANNVSRIYHEFTATIVVNKICFYGNATIFTGIKVFNNDYTPMIDNV
jgi:hypothetical protein